MILRLRPERFLLGLHGLTLLRGWPYGDPQESAATVEAIREVLGRVDRGELEDLVVDDLDLDDAYAAWSATYDTLPNALITAEEPVLRALLRDEAAGLALDVAAGTGRLTALLRDLGHEVVALDRSAGMLASAGGALARVRADLRRLPIRDGAVDLAACALSLTHVQDLGPAIDGLARVVRPGGAVVLTDVHPVAVATGGQAMFRREDGSRAVTRNHLHWVGGYVNAAVEAGLVVERCEEVPVDEAFLEEMRDVGLRSAAGPALLGLPVALLWRLRKPRRTPPVTPRAPSDR